MLTDEALALIRDAVVASSSEHQVRGRLQEASDPERFRSAILAFGFHFIAEEQRELRQRRNGPWGPMVEVDGRQFPPPLEQLELDVLEEWQQMLDRIDEPPVKARCGDLLWVRRHGAQPHLAARAAIEGYLSLPSDDDWREMEQVEGLGRALEIARELRDQALVAVVANVMIAAATEETSSDEDRPGITIRLLRPLVALPAEQRPPDLHEQLRAAESRYGDDPHMAQAFGELIAELASTDEQREIRRGLVRRWIDEAGKGDALLRVLRLQQALEMALSAGLKDEADEVRVLMAQVDEAELPLAKFEVEVELPREEIATFANHLRGLDLREALLAFGAQGPPTGGPTEAEQAAVDTLRDAPLYGQIPRLVLGDVYPAPVFRADTPEKRQRVEAADYRRQKAQLWAIAALPMVSAIFDREPSVERLREAYRSSLLPEELTAQIAAAIHLFGEGQFDLCVHALTPRVEAALREVAAAAGVPVINEPRGEEVGGVATLGAVISRLEGFLDEGWRLYLRTVLTDQLALNLRNSVAHGTRTSFGPADAVLLIHIACFLLRVQTQKS